MTKKSILFIVLIVALVASVGSTFWMATQLPRTAYVDVQAVFDAFKGKRELEARLMNYENQQKAVLDSIALSIRGLQNAASEQPKNNAILVKLQEKQHVYANLSNEFAQKYQEHDQQYAQEVWTQINQYIQEFGKENNYDYIYGANGDGSLMYANSKVEITQDIIAFINQEYEGL